ncbi:MAG: DUF166 family (seleno)protein DfsP [Thermodesulfobacteriota bacterium]
MEKIVIFQQNGSGKTKIKGIQRYGRDLAIHKIFDITSDLPLVIEEPEKYIIDNFSGDLVLSFLYHPDLLDQLALICQLKKIPLIASGQKNNKAITPPTCCGLGEKTSCRKKYSEQFGTPHYRITLKDQRIVEVEVVRGAPCGVTWEVIPKLKGLTVDEARECIAREVQYRCTASPNDFDPISGSNPIHFAGNIHYRALENAVTR